MPLRQFAGDRPAVTAVLCAAAQMIVTLLVLKLGFSLAPPEAAGKVKLVAFASTIVLPLVLVQAFGLWRSVGFDPRGGRLTWPFIAGLMVCALWLTPGVRAPDGSNFAGDAAMQLINAFGEELLFRGVIFAVLLSLPRWRAIALNALLFGSMHLIHGYMDGDWYAALHQAFFTVMGGALFAAMRYSTRSLWLVILLHATLNLSIIYSGVTPALEPAFEWAAGLLELAIAAWVMFRRRTLAPTRLRETA
jgi:membrane protease YdiL (CAAX protease family)